MNITSQEKKKDIETSRSEYAVVNEENVMSDHHQPSPKDQSKLLHNDEIHTSNPKERNTSPTVKAPVRWNSSPSISQAVTSSKEIKNKNSLDLESKNQSATIPFSTSAVAKEPHRGGLLSMTSNMMTSRSVNNCEHSNYSTQPLNDFTSIAKQLEQNINSLVELENKLDASNKDTEDLLVKKNDSFHSKLEQSVEDMKNQQEKERQKIHDTATKIDRMMTLMTDHYRDESDKLTQKQIELTNMQVRSGIQA